MAKRKKGPTIEDLQKGIKDSLKHWKQLRRKGGTDPFYPDGVNMNLTRNHVIYDQGQLRDLCRAQKVRPCPLEARLKLPRKVSEDYCAPNSKAGPCVTRRKARKA